MTQKLILAMILAIAGMSGPIIAGVASNRPSHVQCVSNSECLRGSCCTIAPYKFSVPQCQSMQEEGAQCRPMGHETINTTLTYPDGSELELKGVHYILCPCDYGLTCDPKDGICRDVSQRRDFNHLQNEAIAHED
ncbi:prokineticin Bm8-f isoform X2 [Orussus abietinus]|nr:prokineticin Bm8-f isoform X2 [Orussus abietinus]XP_012283425.1 prokineticin Bm8-f isoform X2 [Orussus abietinus]